MNKRIKSRSKIAFLFLIVSTFTILSIGPAKAQVKRTHHTEKKDVKVRDHRTSKKTVHKNQKLFFDEADALFGTRTSITKAYPGFRFTGAIDRTTITKKLPEGKNSIQKTASGNTVFAKVKNGRITGLSLKRGKIKDVKDGTSNTIVYQEINKTCFKCKEIYHNPNGRSATTRWTTCEVVDCSKDHNALIPGRMVKE